MELEALQRQADEDKSDLLDYIQVAADPPVQSLRETCLLQSASWLIHVKTSAAGCVNHKWQLKNSPAISVLCDNATSMRHPFSPHVG